jgi:outer membrane protein
MKLIKKIFFLTVIILLSINNLKAEDKVAYLDIDFILTNTIAGKLLLENLNKQEEIKINKFKIDDEKFRNNEKKILAKKNLVSVEEIKKEMNELQIEYQKYNNDKKKEIDSLKKKRNTNIINFINSINPIIEKYMTDNSIYILMDKKNIFIAKNDYDITQKLIKLIDNQIKTFEIK